MSIEGYRREIQYSLIIRNVKQKFAFTNKLS